MMQRRFRNSNGGGSSNWRRLLLIVAATLVLCSCRSVTTDRTQPPNPASASGKLWPTAGQAAAQGDQAAAAGEPADNHGANHRAEPLPAGFRLVSYESPALAPQAGTAGQDSPALLASHCRLLPRVCGRPNAYGRYCQPMPAVNPCGPAGPGPYPDDEYLCDGGDADPSVQIGVDWSVRGLNPEDAVVHYDTLDGDTVVQPSNRVCVYAPRFAAVRRVYGAVQHEQLERVAGVERPIQVHRQDDLSVPTSLVQPLQVERQLGKKAANSYLVREAGVAVDNALLAAAVQRRDAAYEDARVLELDALDNAQKAILAEGVEAAIVWTSDQAVEVVIDGQRAAAVVKDRQLQSVYRYDMPPGKPRLRVIKTASKGSAQPGDTVDFTIRFDNVGDQVIGNVTVIDNLISRLEYVADSAQCSLRADFSTQENEGDSLVLRWEVAEPLRVGEGGVIQFRCRVR